MTKYRMKSNHDVIVEARQWGRGERTDGLEVMEPTIHYSRDGRLYYVRGVYEVDRMSLPRHWLSIEPGEDGKYLSYDFTFYEVKIGDKNPADPNDPLVQRYLWSMGVEEMPLPMVFTNGRGRTFVSPGDWIVTDRGETFAMRPDEFTATYEPVETPN